MSDYYENLPIQAGEPTATELEMWHPDQVDEEVTYRKREAIVTFLQHMWDDPETPSREVGRAEVLACAHMGIKPEDLYDLEDSTKLRADVAHYRIMNGLD